MTTTLNNERLNARLRLVERHVRAENEHNLDSVLETFGAQPGFVLNSARFNGCDQVRALYAEFGFGGQGAFAGLHAEIMQRHVSEASVILELQLSGEHVSAWQGIPATGRKFSVPACAVFVFDETERLAEERVYFDSALLLEQLGAI
jgi:steroid delta-isomerase-like uncharacterized protein